VGDLWLVLDVVFRFGETQFLKLRLHLMQKQKPRGFAQLQEISYERQKCFYL